MHNQVNHKEPSLIVKNPKENSVKTIKNPYTAR